MQLAGEIRMAASRCQEGDRGEGEPYHLLFTALQYLITNPTGHNSLTEDNNSSNVCGTSHSTRVPTEFPVGEIPHESDKISSFAKS